jgi:hypothetical protein
MEEKRKHEILVSCYEKKKEKEGNERRKRI